MTFAELTKSLEGSIFREVANLANCEDIITRTIIVLD